MLKFFRIVSFIEGLSYLVILSVTFGIIGREWVSPLGMTHGVLFALYFVLSLMVTNKQGWPVWGWVLLLLASVVPFAFILLEAYLRKTELKQSSKMSQLS
ncbi:DUF3817 domain-containing protein [Reinekea sp.]|jgi:integral membrane protein|uniref:DUF3817 domain-containing protein n=1 Tax=Reinekea sp. TaxID=1970455 RepID=UPI003988C0DB